MTTRENLICQVPPIVILGGTTFTDTPVILRYDDDNMIEIVKYVDLGFTSSIAIYHPDATKLAVINGTRPYLTKEGEKANIELLKNYSDVTVCKLDGKELFEIRHEPGDLFKISAEMHTKDGKFLRWSDLTPIKMFSFDEKEIRLGGITIIGGKINGSKVGIQIGSDGSMALGVNM